MEFTQYYYLTNEQQIQLVYPNYLDLSQKQNVMA